MLEEAAAEIVAAGGPQPHVATVDVAVQGSALELAAEATKALGHVDILVNSAGEGRTLPVDAPEEAWVETMMISFTSRRQLVQALLPSMMARKFGRILNVTGGSEPMRLNSGFAGKAGLTAWGKGLSREIGKYGITINSVAPGRILSEQSLRRYSEEERRAYSEREIPVGRFGTVEEFAYVVVCLASPLGGYVTGAVIPVDGGLRRYAF